MSTQQPGKTSHIRSIILIAACCGAALAQSFAADLPQYNVSSLASLGGTVSRGNSINNRGWVAGYSNLAGDLARHAALWRNDDHRSRHTRRTK